MLNVHYHSQQPDKWLTADGHTTYNKITILYHKPYSDFPKNIYFLGVSPISKWTICSRYQFLYQMSQNQCNGCYMGWNYSASNSWHVNQVLSLTTNSNGFFSSSVCLFHCELKQPICLIFPVQSYKFLKSLSVVFNKR